MRVISAQTLIGIKTIVAVSTACAIYSSIRHTKLKTGKSCIYTHTHFNEIMHCNILHNVIWLSQWRDAGYVDWILNRSRKMNFVCVILAPERNNDRNFSLVPHRTNGQLCRKWVSVSWLNEFNILSEITFWREYRESNTRTENKAALINTENELKDIYFFVIVRRYLIFT